MADIRPATESDAALIRRMVRGAGLPLFNVMWQHFLIAEEAGDVIGVGQVRHLDGTRELGSLVVQPERQRRGIAAQLIAALESHNGYPMYLMCRDGLEPFYGKFGYRRLTWTEMPHPLRVKWVVSLPFRLFGVRVLVMGKDAEGG